MDTITNIRPPFFSGASIAVFLLLFLLAVSNDISFIKFLDPEVIDLRIIVMFLLAEPHFAMTIPLLWGYRDFFKTDKIYFIYIPLAIVISTAVLFYFSLALYSYLFLLANIYHVNRQSRGMLQIQAGASLNTAKLYEFTLHFTCLLIFLSRIFYPDRSTLLALAGLLIVMSLAFAIWRIEHSKPTLYRIFVALQGYLIFLPVIYFDDLILAFAVGISIHYLQYLAISFPVCKKSFGFSLVPLILFLITYSFFSTGSLSGFFTFENLFLIVFIPTTFQLLHFYYDCFIWNNSNSTVTDTLMQASL